MSTTKKKRKKQNYKLNKEIAWCILLKIIMASKMNKRKSSFVMAIVGGKYVKKFSTKGNFK